MAISAFLSSAAAIAQVPQLNPLILHALCIMGDDLIGNSYRL